MPATDAHLSLVAVLDQLFVRDRRTVQLQRRLPLVEPYLLTSGGPGGLTTTVVYQIYQYAVPQQNIGYSAALGIMLLVLAGFAAPCLWLTNRRGQSGSRRWPNGFSIFLLKRFFDAVPEELIQAAAIDGAGPLRTMWSVVLPIARPVLGVISTFAVVNVWKDFLWPLLVLDQAHSTVNTGLIRLQSGTPPEVTYAALVVASVPTIMFFLMSIEGIIRNAGDRGKRVDGPVVVAPCSHLPGLRPQFCRRQCRWYGGYRRSAQPPALPRRARG